MKGISTVIATLLMLVITLGLIGIAYGYITGMIGGRIAVVLTIDELTRCESVGPGQYNITVVLRNDGTTALNLSDIRIWSIYPNGTAPARCNSTSPCVCNTTGWLPAGGTAECDNKTQGAAGINGIVAEGGGQRARGYKNCL